MNCVRQDLDQALPQEVCLTVKEAKEVADVTVDGTRRLFRKLLEENSDILDAYGLVGTVSVEDLPCQVTNDVIGDLGSLPFDDKSDKLGQISRQVLLVIE